MLDHEAIVTIALRAGEAILEVYNSPSTIQVTTKDDDSPLTEADIAAHEVIMNGLSKICLLYTSPSPRDRQKSRMPSSA